VTAPEIMSVAIIILALVALLIQIFNLRRNVRILPLARAFCLIYFIGIYSMTLMPHPGYLILSGVLTRLGVLFLLLTLLDFEGK
jgi:hypothetical protein